MADHAATKASSPWLKDHDWAKIHLTPRARDTASRTTSHSMLTTLIANLTSIEAMSKPTSRTKS